jgi:acetyl esterase/lipase
MFTSLTEETDELDPLVTETDLYATGRDGNNIRIHIWRMKDGLQQNAEPSLIVLYHGGGFVMGSPTQMSQIARILVKQFHAVIAAPAYRLAPEYPFPCGINDCWDGLKWIAENALGELKAHPHKGFIIGGFSAGATISIVLSHLARDEKLEPPLTGLWNSCGSCRLADGHKLGDEYDMRLLSRNQEEMINDPLLSADMQKLFLRCLKPDITSELYAPMVRREGHRHYPIILLTLTTGLADGRQPQAPTANILPNLRAGCQS